MKEGEYCFLMKTNQELLDEANSIDFKLTKQGNASTKHSNYERGLFFIRKALEVHGMDTYRYGNVHYVNNSTKVEIVCTIHGSFFQQPNNHVNSQNGCPKCAKVHQPTTEEFVSRSREVHQNKYDYSSTQYKSMHEKLEIICPKHGVFSQEAILHLRGCGCPRCGGNHRPGTDEWRVKANLIHGNKYDYSNVTYVHNKSCVEIVCNIHGAFLQTPEVHLRGCGCPKCAGHNQNILYLVMCKDTGWYKIGITTSNVNSRMTSIGGNLEEVFHVVCESPREHESLLHKLYEKDREYNPCVKSGNTEFFSLTKEQVAKIRQYMASIAIN